MPLKSREANERGSWLVSCAYRTANSLLSCTAEFVVTKHSEKHDHGSIFSSLFTCVRVSTFPEHCQLVVVISCCKLLNIASWLM